MAGKGPKPKPTALKLVEGNRGKRKLTPELEPQFKVGGTTPPVFLSATAKAE